MFAATDLAGPRRRLWPHLLAAAAVFVFDGVLLGQSMITMIVALVMSIRGVIHLCHGAETDVPRAHHGARVIAVYLALVVAVFGLIHVDNDIAHQRADRLVEALRAYRETRGAYPPALGDLVPDFLPAVPLAKHTLLDREFRYTYFPDEEDGLLAYTSEPPFRVRFYLLRSGRWSTMD